MPEMTFDVRWPDGPTASCYSPSLVMHDHLEVGASYPVAEFVNRVSRALREASERVRARYGMACTSAAQQEAEIRRTATSFPTGEVEILRMEPPLPGTEMQGTAGHAATAPETAVPGGGA
ncbi:MSMEG_0570 family nitrogen starvation response protein [Myceligenerans pegani]|uniref:MSMEG_0570 family nitrogen starvation response protein n=1 Tax=Myceligenerans pegani TaxID=2776917 RepID=A0ABR9MVK2_9MICO|nr:MSMEG_0570 family nitrogen starvation response protein [Myceligenerans sp. TRM 65318]MBE1875414.1 MSMEG_0570 family nitrogen starvation response protein [Myceligenerans sp. TRM 65318]MBE3017685.1 MSMEG_0570 family nitrogen starvation response protein [Myceligenerans sp. TRM 65318]